MDSKQWKYKVSSGKMPMILTLVMFALFGGLTIWLHRIQNGAFIFTGALAVVTLILLGATVYRFYFYKVFIGKEGFYYQTGMKNGTYYPYDTVNKAWISSGTVQNGAQEEYCNIEITGGSVIRFPFFYNDKKGIKYLIKQAEQIETVSVNNVLPKSQIILVPIQLQVRYLPFPYEIQIKIQDQRSY